MCWAFKAPLPSGHRERNPLPAPEYSGRGRPANRVRRDAEHAPVSAKQLALSLPAKAWKTVTWREGTRHPLRSRFAAVRIRPAHRDHKLTLPREPEWLLIEWPRGETEPRKYWMSNLAKNIRLRNMVALAKQRWIIERDYEELKQELGLATSKAAVGAAFIITHTLHSRLWFPGG